MNLITCCNAIERTYQRFDRIVYGKIGGSIVSLMLDRASRENPNPLLIKTAQSDTLLNKIAILIGTIFTKTLDVAGNSYQNLLDNNDASTGKGRFLRAIDFLLGLTAQKAQEKITPKPALTETVARYIPQTPQPPKEQTLASQALTLAAPMASFTVSLAQAGTAASARLAKRGFDSLFEQVQSSSLAARAASSASGLLLNAIPTTPFSMPTGIGDAYSAVARTPSPGDPGDEPIVVSDEDIARANQAMSEQARVEKARKATLAKKENTKEELEMKLKNLVDAKALLQQTANEKQPPSEVAMLQTALNLNQFEYKRYLMEVTPSVVGTLYYLIETHECMKKQQWEYALVNVFFSLAPLAGFCTSIGIPDIYSLKVSTPKQLSFLTYRSLFLGIGLTTLRYGSNFGVQSHLSTALATCTLTATCMYIFSNFLNTSISKRLHTVSKKTKTTTAMTIAELNTSIRTVMQKLEDLKKSA